MATREREEGIPEHLEQRYNAMLKRTGKKLWHLTTESALTGFGKGVLITAAIVGSAILVGSGLGYALSFLALSSTGLLTLAVGGTLGAVAETLKSYSRISAKEAVEEERRYEDIRAVRAAAPSSLDPAPDKNHALRELQRREMQSEPAHQL